jgi:hypothetical protein
MANRNTVGFGLIPSGALGATPSTGGQNKYKIDSGYGSSIYLGQPVQYDTAGGANDNPGYVINGQDAITRPTIGVFNGCFYTDATTNKPTFSSYFPRTTAPANSEDIDAFIIDNPFQQYNVQLDTRLAATAILAQAEMGSSIWFNSIWTVKFTINRGNRSNRYSKSMETAKISRRSRE